MEFIIEYIDLAWLILVPVLVKKRLWLKTILFILACVLILRFQVEFMQAVGFPDGFFTLMDFPLMQRGSITYGIFIAFFLILTHFSQDEDAYIFMAGAISVFFAAFMVSSVVLIL